MGWLNDLRAKARFLKAEVLALYLASRDPRTPLAAKLLVVLVVAYALSPVDLIPDFIPVLGLLDDIVIVPLGITLALRMIPPAVMADARAAGPQAAARVKRLALLGLAMMVVAWIAIGIFLFVAFRGLVTAF